MPDLTTLLSKFLTDLYSGSIGGSSQWSSLTLTKNVIGVTPTGALFLVNTTDAAAGAQQMSPALRFRGEGWKTDATAASQTVDFLADVLPVQGTSAPTGSWRLGYAINGGSRTNVLDVSTTVFATTLPIRIGGTPAPATVGIGLTNDEGITFRQAGGAGNYPLIKGDSSNNIFIGGTGPGTVLVPHTIRSNATAVDLGSTTDPWTNIYGGTSIALVGANLQRTNVLQATTSLTTNSGIGTATATNLIPAGSVVVGVSARVTTVIAGAGGLTSFSLGDGSDADRWGAGLALSAGTTVTLANATITSVPLYAAAASVVLTANAGQFDSGVIRLTVHYLSLTAASS